MTSHPFDPSTSCRPRQTSFGVVWRVWAPRAERIDLVLRDERYPMKSEDRGFFVFESDAAPGARYGYSLDGGAVRPDPCTLHQPDGVHRESAIYFPEVFPWQNDNIEIDRANLILYEMHIGTFTKEGTFAAAIERLDDLVELGINALEILPVAQFPGSRNWGYDGVHPFATQNTYGGPRDFQRFIDAAHGKGLAVFLDVVFNHLGPEGNYLNEFGPYFTNRSSTPWGPAFNFDGHDSGPVRNWVKDCVWQWIHDFRLDGLRLDAVHAIVDSSTPHILADLNRVADEAAAARGGTCTMIAESLLNDDVMVTAMEKGGHGFDAEWNEDFHHAVSAWMTGERDGKYVDYGERRAVANVFRDTFHLAGQYSQFYKRNWGRPVHAQPRDRFIISLQNHDHIGNRARGERIASLVTEEQLRLGACLTILAPFIPMIYMGEEYAEKNPFLFFCEFSDPRLIDAVRNGRKRDYGLKGEVPDPQSENTFLGSILAWSWEEGLHSRTRALYRELIQLRKAHDVLRDPRNHEVSLLEDEDTAILVLSRGENSEMKCLFNLSETEAKIPDRIQSGRPIWRSGEETAMQLLPYETLVRQDPA